LHLFFNSNSVNFVEGLAQEYFLPLGAGYPSYATGESQRPAKSYTALQAVRHRFNIYADSCFALIGAMTRRWAQQIRHTLCRNTASIMKGLVLEYLTRNNQQRRQKNIQEGAIEKKRKKKCKEKTSNNTPRKPFFINCGGLGNALDNCPGPNLKDILHHEPSIKVKTFSRKTPIFEKMPTFKKLLSHSRAKKLFA